MEYIAFGLSTAGFALVWSLVGKYISPVLPSSIASVINITVGDLYISLLHFFWIGLASGFIYLNVVRGNQFINRITSTVGVNV